MPYSSVDDIPGNVPKDKEKQWLEVFNSSFSAEKKKGKNDKEAESVAFRNAYGVVKKEKMEDPKEKKDKENDKEDKKEEKDEKNKNDKEDKADDEKDDKEEAKKAYISPPPHIPAKHQQLWNETFKQVHDKHKQESKGVDTPYYDGPEIKSYKIATGRVKAEMDREFNWNTFIHHPTPIEDQSIYELQDSGITKSQEKRIDFEKSSVDIGLGVIYGIASKADVDDSEGELIEIQDLRKAAHGFMEDSRMGDIDHDWKTQGSVVESLVIDKAFIDLIKAGKITEGDWIIGYKPFDSKIAEKAASGEDYHGFSIAGTCRRV